MIRSIWVWFCCDLEEVNWRLASAIAIFGLATSWILPEREYVVVGASTALIIAFVAYPWQKRKDRTHSLDEEKRKALAEFFGAVQNSRSQIAAARFDVEEREGALLALGTYLTETERALVLVELSCDPKAKELSEQCRRLRDCLWIGRGHLRHQFLDRALLPSYEEAAGDLEEAVDLVNLAYESAMHLARKDLFPSEPSKS